jgi:ribosomal protein S18 acetylase RimI-like enzyme
MSDAQDPLELRVLPLERRHLDSCAAIVGRLQLFVPYGFTPEAASRLLATALANARADLLVVEATRHDALAQQSDGAVAGFAWFVTRGAFDRSGYLRLIAVDDRYHGGGVGRMLMAELERRHLAQGGIVLLAAASNAAAHRFYERLGYQQVGELPDYVKPHLHERIYYKPPPRRLTDS